MKTLEILLLSTWLAGGLAQTQVGAERQAPGPAQSEAESAPAAAAAQLPAPRLVDFAQTPATEFDHLFGQAVLLEFFAYW